MALLWYNLLQNHIIYSRISLTHFLPFLMRKYYGNISGNSNIVSFLHAVVLIRTTSIWSAILLLRFAMTELGLSRLFCLKLGNM